MTRFGVGIWGAGWVSQGHLTGYLAQPDCRVVAIGSRQRASAEALAARNGVSCALYDDFGALLAHPELQIVSICTPHHLHPENTIQAAKAGKHIFVEKPIALTPADLYAMRDAVEQAGVRTAVGFVVRWTPLAQRLRSLVESGALGRVFLTDVDYWHSRQRPELYRRKATGGSALLLGGCHAIDTARYITGLDPVEVTARAVQVPGPPEEAYEFDCVEACLIRYSNGAVGRISAVVKGHLPYQFNIDILGDKGTIRNNRVFLPKDAEVAGFRQLSEPGPDSGDVAHHPFAGLIRHFLDCIAAGKETEVSVGQAVLTHEVCFAALLSERTGRPVPLPLGAADRRAVAALLES
jgi:UDP-N-acetyl-2-amino-2-deoxyglucuronate dehydrogenase